MTRLILSLSLVGLSVFCGGGVSITLNVHEASGPAEAVEHDATVLRTRLAEAGIQVTRLEVSPGSIRLSLANADDLAVADRLACCVGQFELRMVEDEKTAHDLLEAIDNSPTRRGSPGAEGPSLLSFLAAMHGGFGIAAADSARFVERLRECRDALDRRYEVLLAPREEYEGNWVIRTYLVRAEPAMPVRGFREAGASRYPGPDPGLDGSWVVDLQLSPIDTEPFAELTGSCIGRRIAMVVDGVVQSAPVVQAQVPDGRLVLACRADRSRAESMAAVLKSGPTRNRWEMAGAAN